MHQINGKRLSQCVLTAVLLLSLSACGVESYGQHAQGSSEVTNEVDVTSSTEPVTEVSTTTEVSTSAVDSSTQVSSSETTEVTTSDETTESTSSESNLTTELTQEKSGLQLRAVPVQVDPQAWTQIPEGNWTKWPELSSIPIQIEGNFEIFREQADSEKPLEGALVILDPGHGGWDPGVVRENVDPIVRETDITLDVSLKAKEQLEALGARVLINRTTDDTLLLYNRVALHGNYALDELQRIVDEQGGSDVDLSWTEAPRKSFDRMIELATDRPDRDPNQSGRGLAQGIGIADELRQVLDLQSQLKHVILISVHVNSIETPDRTVQGMQSYVFSNEAMLKFESDLVDSTEIKDTPVSPAYSMYSGRAHNLAVSLTKGFETKIPKMLNQYFFEKNGSYNPDIRETNLAIVRESNMTSLLLEMGYITDDGDLAIMDDPEGRRKIAEGITEGVRNYYAEEVWK